MGSFTENLLLVYVGLGVMELRSLRGVAQLPQVLSASLLFAYYLLGGLRLDPLSHLGRVAHPSVFG
jgi:hypothetical protein